jgi:predicted DNA-binding protein
MDSESVVFSIRLRIEDKVRLKLLALAHNTTMSNLLHELISEIWEKEGEVMSSNIYTKAASKEFRRLIK